MMQKPTNQREEYILSGKMSDKIRIRIQTDVAYGRNLYRDRMRYLEKQIRSCPKKSNIAGCVLDLIIDGES